MSCDFLVFEPEAAPRDRKAFMRWVEQITDWDLADDSWEQPSTASTRLQAWYRDMLQDFPALNGPDAVPDDDEISRLTEYNFTPAAIYAGFRWSEGDHAYEACKRLAFERGLGFFDPQSEDAGIFFPDLPDGGQLKASGSWLSRLLG